VPTHQRCLACGPVSGLPPVGQSWTFTHVDWEIVFGHIASVACGSLDIDVRASGPGTYDGAVTGCPGSPPPTYCPSRMKIPLTLLQCVARGTLEAGDSRDRGRHARMPHHGNQPGELPTRLLTSRGSPATLWEFQGFQQYRVWS
jgi:hypothetical protein